MTDEAVELDALRAHLGATHRRTLEALVQRLRAAEEREADASAHAAHWMGRATEAEDLRANFEIGYANEHDRRLAAEERAEKAEQEAEDWHVNEHRERERAETYKAAALAAQAMNDSNTERAEKAEEQVANEKDAYDSLHLDIIQLEAENERLRTALVDIEAGHTVSGGLHTNVAWNSRQKSDRARQALGEEE